MWKTGRSGTCVMLNGITDGAWLWTTTMTSGRALKISPWMNRSRTALRTIGDIRASPWLTDDPLCAVRPPDTAQITGGSPGA